MENVKKLKIKKPEWLNKHFLFAAAVNLYICAVSVFAAIGISYLIFA